MKTFRTTDNNPTTIRKLKNSHLQENNRITKANEEKSTNFLLTTPCNDLRKYKIKIINARRTVLGCTSELNPKIFKKGKQAEMVNNADKNLCTPSILVYKEALIFSIQ